jgi:tripartite-type tricarboxylate transporter receptor subunit TctC
LEEIAVRFVSRILIVAATVLAGSVGARAQDYPNRNITLIVPFAPGGATDILARQLSTHLAAKLGQTVVVENVSGGGASIGPSRVARSAPDGYTILIHNLAISAMGSLNPKLSFDVEKDLAPITFVNSNPLFLIGRPTLPAKTLPELIAWMKTTPAKMAHVGIGSTAHLSNALFAQSIGVSADQIPYRGAGPAIQDIIAGHVDLFFTTANAVMEPIKAGMAKGFGITAKQRFAELPEVPSLVQDVGPKLEILFWHALFVPAATPRPVIDKLNAAMREILDDPAVVKLWADTGIAAYPKEQRGPQAAQALLRAEIKRWGDVIRDNKIEAPM